MENEKEKLPPPETPTVETPKEEPSNDTPEVEQPNPEPENQGDDIIAKLNALTASIEKRAKAAEESLKGVNDFFQSFTKTVEKINTRLDDVESKLPHTLTKAKPNVSGYYDFDPKAHAYLNREAQTEYTRGREALEVINRILK